MREFFKGLSRWPAELSLESNREVFVAWGNWRVAALGLGGALAFGAAFVFSLWRESSLRGESNWERRRHWRNFAGKCFETGLASLFLGACAVFLWLATWLLGWRR